MKLTYLATPILALNLSLGLSMSFSAGLLTACAPAENAANQATDKNPAKAVDAKAANVPGVDISQAPAGTYLSEPGHAYIAFSYDHLGYSKPILRWGSFARGLS